MLAKCVNPVCNAPFRRLSDGKLFLLQADTSPNRKAFAPGKAKPPRRVEYFWLCSDCAQLLTLIFNSKTGVTTVPLPGSTPDLRQASTTSALGTNHPASRLEAAAARQHA